MPLLLLLLLIGALPVAVVAQKTLDADSETVSPIAPLEETPIPALTSADHATTIASSGGAATDNQNDEGSNSEKLDSSAALVAELETAIAGAYDAAQQPKLAGKAPLEALVYDLTNPDKVASSFLDSHGDLVTRAKQTLYELVVEEDKQLMEMMAKEAAEKQAKKDRAAAAIAKAEEEAAANAKAKQDARDKAEAKEEATAVKAGEEARLKTEAAAAAAAAKAEEEARLKGDALQVDTIEMKAAKANREEEPGLHPDGAAVDRGNANDDNPEGSIIGVSRQVEAAAAAQLELELAAAKERLALEAAEAEERRGEGTRRRGARVLG